MKNFFKDFTLGVSTFFKAFNFVFNNKMGHYFLYPLIITIAMALAATKAIRQTVNYIKGMASDYLNITPIEGDSWWELSVAFLQSISEQIISIALWIAFYFILHKTMKYIVIVLMSPVMALVSEKTEKVLTGNDYSFDYTQFLKDVWRGVVLAGRNFVIEMSIILGLWIANLAISFIVPPLTVITSPLAIVIGFVVSSYYYGFTTMDYTNERKRMKLKESVTFIKNNKGLAVGNGLVFNILIWIPFIGAYLGPIFATILGTVGATLAIHEKVGIENTDGFILPDPIKK